MGFESSSRLRLMVYELMLSMLLCLVLRRVPRLVHLCCKKKNIDFPQNRERETKKQSENASALPICSTIVQKERIYINTVDLTKYTIKHCPHLPQSKKKKQILCYNL